EDECEDKPCGDRAICFNTNGSYYCECKRGFMSKTKNFTAITGQCQDINECTANISSCPEYSECKNTIGSFQCVCLPGYQDKIVGSSYTCAGEETVLNI
ncbi:adhesion G protein-coupled receptor E5 isoform X1, partial [Tachysurus ichikawai]